MDGGNIKAPLWFCGIEWSSNGEAITDKITRDTYLVDELSVPYLSSKWKEAHSQYLKWQFDQKLSKIICEAIDYQGDYKSYLNSNFCDQKSNEFKLNLFPLAATDIKEWNEEHIRITGHRIKYHYMYQCAFSRFILFYRLVNLYHPKVIVCFGRTFLEEYFMAFMGDNYKCSRKMIKLGLSTTIEVIEKQDHPVLLVCPFLGWGLNSDSKLRDLGKIIKSYLN